MQNYSYFSGLNLLEEKSVICHYDETLDPKIYGIAKKINSQVIALPENSGIIINDGKLETVGDVFVFDGEGKRQICD